MEIAFSSAKLRKQCVHAKQMKKTFGEIAGPLQRRLTELEAADTLADLPSHAKCHPLVGKRAGRYSLKLTGNVRLIVEPNHHPLPTTNDGGVDLTKITKIRVVEVVDYHGE
jgi:proteic killer suppression protein